MGRSIEHAGVLEELEKIPAYLVPEDATTNHIGHASCAFCGVGDGGRFVKAKTASADAPLTAGEKGSLAVLVLGLPLRLPVTVLEDQKFLVETRTPLVLPGGTLSAKLVLPSGERDVLANEVDRRLGKDGGLTAQIFNRYVATVATQEGKYEAVEPTRACVKLRVSATRQAPVFPIHTAPSELVGNDRRTLSYQEAIERLATLLLEHRPPRGRTLVYACGQIDYFTIFAFQDALRLLGVRSLAGNAEHCLNAGAVHNEMLTGQEGPFLTIDQGIEGERLFHILNGWNGLITHPPAFHAILRRRELDAYMVEVAITESAKKLIARQGPDRLLLIRSATDPHLALSVAHEVLAKHPAAVDQVFVDRWSDKEKFAAYAALAREERFEPRKVAERIAAAPELKERIERGIRDIAAKLARPDLVPINIPSVGLSQTKGAVAHCLWGSALALVGKYGISKDGKPLGGTLRLPGQINAETEVQGLSRRSFMGRIPFTKEGTADFAKRMGAPEDAYKIALEDNPRAALDYGEPNGEKELFLCFGTQFESNMLGRKRWIEKLTHPNTTVVAVDPIPDPFTLKHAKLVIPSPPHAATTKLYQNGEWRLTLSTPIFKAAEETRTDATIVYDAAACVSRRVRAGTAGEANKDLERIAAYMKGRFEDLPRIAGEASRPFLWKRIQEYMSGGQAPLYCRPEDESGVPIPWEQLLEKGTLIYGGVGTKRYVLDKNDPGCVPFRDVFRKPRKFAFFVPTVEDLSIPEGIVLSSGRSTLSDDAVKMRFAITTFNSGKATPAVDMPDENPLFISPVLAAKLGFVTGNRVRVTGIDSGGSVELPVVVSGRLLGDTVYTSFHKSRAEVDRGVYLNDVTAHGPRCPYTSQSTFKATLVKLEKIS